MVTGLSTVILNEGKMLFHAETNPETMRFSFGSEIKINDMVELDDNPANTYDACGGLPVVRFTSLRNVHAIGQIVSQPRIIRLPMHSTDNWKDCLENEWYRTAVLDTSIIQPLYITQLKEPELREALWHRLGTLQTQRMKL